jgi:hypothetical protein
MAYIIFSNHKPIGEGRGEREKTPCTKGRKLPISCLASLKIVSTRVNCWSLDEMEGDNTVKAWLGIIGVCVVFAIIGYFGYLLFSR